MGPTLPRCSGQVENPAIEPRWTKAQRAKVVQQLHNIKHCPVTNGLPTTMTLAGFEAACDRYQERDGHGFASHRAYKHGWCATCQGKQRPKELLLVSLEQLQKLSRV